MGRVDQGSGPQRVVIGGSGDEPGEAVSPWARRDGAAAEASGFSFPAPVGSTQVPAPTPPIRPPSPDDVWRRAAADTARLAPSARHPEFTYDAYPDDRQGGDAATTAAVEGGEAGPVPDRRRRVAAGLVAIIVALIAGWAVGRGDGEGAAETIDSAPSTTSDPETAVAETVLNGDTLPPASAPTTEAGPTTTRPRPTTTTTTTLPPVWGSSTIELDPRLTGTNDRIVVATAESLVEIELGTGATRSLPTRSGLLRQPVIGIVAGPDWLVVTPEDGSPPRVIVDGESGAPMAITIDGVDGWGFFWEAGTDRFWTIEFDERAGSVDGITPYDVRTGERGELVDTSGLWPSRGDPAGGVVVGDPAGGVFALSAGGSRRLGGYPVALGVSALLTYRCGESLDDCGYVLVDRSTGEGRPVPVEASANELTGDWWTPPNPMPQITSDGRYALVSVRTEEMPVPALIDTETGAVVLFAGERESAAFGLVQPVFSSDERFVFVVIDGVLVAHEIATGERFPVAPSDESLSTVRVVTVRPAAG